MKATSNLRNSYINTVNNAIKKVVNSQHSVQDGRLYFIVHKDTGSFGLTTNKKQASSVHEVVSWIHEISENIFNHPENYIERKAILKLSNNTNTFLKQFKQSQTSTEKNYFFDRIFRALSFFFQGKSIEGLIDNIQENLEKSLYTYGHSEKTYVPVDPETKQTRAPLTIRTTVKYSAEARKQRNRKRKAEFANGITVWNKLTKSNISIKRFSEAFSSHFYEVFKNQIKDKKDEVLYDFVESLFFEFLNQNKGRTSSTRAIKTFKDKFIKLIVKKNHQKMQGIDREIFRDIVGTLVHDGRDMRPAKDLPCDHPTIKQWIRDYEDRTWKSKEVREFRYDLMDKKKLKSVTAAVKEVMDRKAFKKALAMYIKEAFPL